jgi:iron complex transport system substrate-binding protein
MKVGRRALIALWVVGAMAAGCRKKAPPGNGATRIVSLTPSTTETLFAIGAGAKVVGRSRFCDYPPEAEKLPAVGGYVDTSFEAILALRPDLVVGARGPAGTRVTDRLEAQGIGTFFPPTESLADVKSMIVALGERVGAAPAARELVAKMDARQAALEAALAGRRRERVLLVFGLQPVVVAGPGSFPDEMLKRAGGDNVVTEGTPYPTLSIERLMALDADVILNAAMAEAGGLQRINVEAPGWKELRAVKTGRVVPLADESVLRPGPRVVDGMAVIARALHPDVSLP